VTGSLAGALLPRRGRGVRGPASAGGAAHASAVGASAPLDTNYEIASRESLVYVVPALAEAVQKVGNSGPSLAELRPYEIKAREADELARVRRLKRWAMLSAVRELLPHERVSDCCRRPVVRPGEKLPDAVEVYRSVELRDARFHRLAVCGDVWRCPVCAPYVAAERAVELRRVGREHLDAGGGALMVALTFRHHAGHDLVDILTRFAAAREDLYRQRAFRALLASVGYVGDVRALEVTYGENGWHPHTHDLFFIESPLPSEGEEIERVLEMGGESLSIRTRQPSPLLQFGQDFFRMWRKAARKHGLDALRDGFHVRATLQDATEDEWDALTGYMQDRHEVEFGGNWDAAREMTGAVSKLGRKGGRTPMQLLADFALDGDVKAGSLFQVYARAFKGRRQLSWSSSLKKLYPSTEPTKSDQQAAEHIPAEYVHWASITWESWKKVLRAGGRVRGELLDLAARNDRAGMLALIQSCEDGTLKQIVSIRRQLLNRRVNNENNDVGS
jgi:hypothetical protein